jgi:hypothetical protein
MPSNGEVEGTARTRRALQRLSDSGLIKATERGLSRGQSFAAPVKIRVLQRKSRAKGLVGLSVFPTVDRNKPIWIR